MYKIIGADGKAYGPVTAEQIRLWISEGRVNAQTQIQAEGTAEWRSLSTFPEFMEPAGIGAEAASSGPAPFAATQSTGNREAALAAVKGPAIALKVTAIIGWILMAFGLLTNVLNIAGIQLIPTPPADDSMPSWMRMQGVLGIIGNLVGIGIGAVIFMGSTKLQNLKDHGFVLTAAVLAMVPCLSPCCLIGLPIGIWAIVVINRADVKPHFS